MKNSSVNDEENTNSTADVDNLYAPLVAEISLFVFLWIANITGNVLLCEVIRRSRRVQSTTNYFVVAMALSDIVFAIIPMPFIMGRLIAGSWIFSDVICRVIRYVQFAIPGISIYILLSISVDRYYTIIYPLSFKIKRTTAKHMIVVCWIVSLLYCVFCLIIFGTKTDKSGQPVCLSYVRMNNWAAVAYIVSIVLIQFICPSVFMFVLYAKVFKFIWRTNGCRFQRTGNHVSRTKVAMVKMLMITSAISMCLLSLLYITVIYFSFSGFQQLQDYIIIRLSVWFVFCAGVAKPLLYLIFNSNFRRGCREVFFCLSGRKCSRNNTYAVTTAPSYGKKNHVGIMAVQTDIPSPSHAFDRRIYADNHSWTNNNVTTYV